MKRIILTLIVSLCTAMSWAQTFIPNVGAESIVTSINAAPLTINLGDGFGSAIANIGDMDKDGVEDLAVGAFRDDDGGSGSLNYGAVYVCFMNANKTIKTALKISRSSTGLGDIASGDEFGTSVANIGDLNEDGYVDLAIGAPNSDTTLRSTCGAVYIVFLSDVGVIGAKKLMWKRNNAPDDMGVGTAFGTTVTSLGDIDGDDVNDIAVGGPGHRVGSSARGAVWTLFMNKNGTVKSDAIVASGAGWGVTLANNDEFGAAVKSVGDLNEDGIGDVLVGSPGDDEGGNSLGALYLLYLNNTGTVSSYKKYIQPFHDNINLHTTTGSFGTALEVTDINQDGTPDFLVGSLLENGYFILATDSLQNIISAKKIIAQMDIHWNSAALSGINFSAIATLHDIDGDGKTELVTGASGYDSPSANHGALFVMDMDSVMADLNVGEVITYHKYSELSDTIANFDASDLFGSAVCDLGDVNGDGFHDMAVGALQDDDGGTDRGAVYIVFLDTLQNAIDVQKISSTTGGFGTGLDDNDYFGNAVAAPGDLDGDDVPDLVVGAYQDDDGSSNQGCVWVIYLNSDGTVKGKHKISDTRGGFTGTIANAFGWSVAAIGDINNDGIGDLAVGDYTDDDGGTDRGAVWILFMNAADSVSSYQKISDTQGDFSETFSGNTVHFGKSVCAAGDLNGDTYEDIVVGSTAMDGTGAVYVLYLGTDGKVDGYKKINNAASNFPATLQSAKRFGSSVAVLDDTDGNGYKEIVIGQELYTSYGSDKGAVWIAFTDSLYNVDYARKISEETKYFNATLFTNAQFGASVSVYMAADSTQRLMAGAYTTDADLRGGSVLNILFNSYGKHSFNIPPPSTSANFGFYDLNRSLDGGIYFPPANVLRFKYYEEYRPGALSYKVYRSNQTLLYSSVATALYNETTGNSSKALGQNYFRLNLGTGGLLLMPHVNYILEVINEKGESMFLRFRKKTYNEGTGTGTIGGGLGGG